MHVPILCIGKHLHSADIEWNLDFGLDARHRPSSGCVVADGGRSVRFGGWRGRNAEVGAAHKRKIVAIAQDEIHRMQLARGYVTILTGHLLIIILPRCRGRRFGLRDGYPANAVRT